MSNDEKIEQMQIMLGDNFSTKELGIYLRQAKQKILNRRYPYGNKTELDENLEQLQIELAIVLFNERGVEGQTSHNENGVSRSYRTENDILSEIVPLADVL